MRKNPMEKVKMNLKISNNDLKEYSNTLYNEIQNDKFFSRVKEEGWADLEIKNNVTKFKEYLADMHKAEEIKTYEDCLKNNMTSRLVLIRNRNIIERSYEPLKPYQDYIDYISKFFYADFGDLPHDASFNNVIKRIKSSLGRNYKSNKWAYLSGTLRSGRSYAALAFLNWYYEKNKDNEKIRYAFIDFPLRVKELNDLYFKNKTDFNELIDAYSNIDYLVIDNFGNEYKNELIRDGIIYPILMNRAAKKKMTIFTSDFSLSELTYLYNFKKGYPDLMAKKILELLKSTIGEETNCGNLPIY